jgi:hypothetical protein
LKTGIIINSISDKSGEKIAEMIIEGNNMGINSITKEANKLGAKGESIPQLATDLTNLLSDNINAMRSFL